MGALSLGVSFLFSTEFFGWATEEGGQTEGFRVGAQPYYITHLQCTDGGFLCIYMYF